MDGRRGQSETLGYVLIIGFTLISVGAIAAFGGTTLDSTQQRIGTQTAENALSQFDSRASMVALGATDAQYVSFGDTRGGTYSVDPTAGWLRIVHENETAVDRTELYNTSLGAVHYRNGDTELGYQAGGLWRKDASSVMLSPPEFRYRGSTLTLPLIEVNGKGQMGGRPTAAIRTVEERTKIYPNASRPTPNENPVESGSVTVTVHSEYYDAWGRFFESRTDGNVSVNESNHTASVALVAPSTQGNFEMPLEGNDLTLQGIQSHQLDQFTLTIFSNLETEANFNNLDWSLCAQSGTKEFEVHLGKGNGTKAGDYATTTIYYSPDGQTYQTWQTDSFTFETESNSNTDWNGDGDKEDKRLVVNLTTEDLADYEDISGTVNSLSNCGFDANTFEKNVTFDGHPAAGEPKQYSTTNSPGVNTSENVSFVIDHYLASMGPTVDLTVTDSNQDTVSEGVSTGYLGYDAAEGYYLTYMHVTENPVNVTLTP